MIESFGTRRSQSPPEPEEPVEESGPALLQMQPVQVLVVPQLDEAAVEQVRARIHELFYTTARAALEQAVADVAGPPPPDPT